MSSARRIIYPGLILLLGGQSALAQEVCYAYAGLGRLIAAMDPQGQAAPAIFDWVREHGRIAPREMLRTFNCGIGMAVIVPRPAASAAQALLTEQGEAVYEIGYIDARPGSGEAVEIIE
ncbi:MAG: AIR synthase-related protein [Gammaproteobacteria bacterium]